MKYESNCLFQLRYTAKKKRIFSINRGQMHQKGLHGNVSTRLDCFGPTMKKNQSDGDAEPMKLYVLWRGCIPPSHITRSYANILRPNVDPKAIDPDFFNG